MNFPLFPAENWFDWSRGLLLGLVIGVWVMYCVYVWYMSKGGD